MPSTGSVSRTGTSGIPTLQKTSQNATQPLRRGERLSPRRGPAAPLTAPEAPEAGGGSGPSAPAGPRPRPGRAAALASGRGRGRSGGSLPLGRCLLHAAAGPPAPLSGGGSRPSPRAPPGRQPLNSSQLSCELAGPLNGARALPRPRRSRPFSGTRHYRYLPGYRWRPAASRLSMATTRAIRVLIGRRGSRSERQEVRGPTPPREELGASRRREGKNMEAAALPACSARRPAGHAGRCSPPGSRPCPSLWRGAQRGPVGRGKPGGGAAETRRGEGQPSRPHTLTSPPGSWGGAFGQGQARARPGARLKAALPPLLPPGPAAPGQGCRVSAPFIRLSAPAWRAAELHPAPAWRGNSPRGQLAPEHCGRQAAVSHGELLSKAGSGGTAWL